MDRKKIEIIIAIVVIIALIVLLFFVLRPSEAPAPADPSDETAQEEQRQPERVTTVDSRTVESPPDVIARAFVERFGSYSTEVDYQNVEDVKRFATASLSGRLDGMVADARALGDTSYYGVSTRVITISPVVQDEATATFTITTQRSESINSPGNTSVRYQDIVVELAKSGTRWLVDDFTWSE